MESGSETVTLSPTHGDILPSVSEVDLFTCLLPVVEHIHALWELVLTAEPLVIMASTPAISSATVQYLTTIIYPNNRRGERLAQPVRDDDRLAITPNGASSITM